MRVNIYAVANHLIRMNYRIPCFPEITIAKPGDSFMTADHNQTIDIGEMLHLLQRQMLQMQEKLAVYEPIIEKYASIKPTTEYWSSGRAGEYDPGSGFTGTVSGSYVKDDYKAAREAWLKFHPISPGSRPKTPQHSDNGNK